MSPSPSSPRSRAAGAPAPALDPSFRALADGLTDLVLRFDVRQRLLFANRAYEQASGRSANELLGRELADLGLDAASVVRLRGAMDAVLGGAPDATARHECPTAGGARRWFESRFVPERDAGGAPIALLCVSRDVTDEIAAEEAVRAREAHFELLYAAAPVGIGSTTLDGRWLDANPRLCAMLGYTVDELRALSSAELTPPGDAALHGPALLARGDGDHTAIKRYRRRDGTYLWASVSVRVARDAHGRPLHLVGIAEDVGERLAAERALRESEAALRESEARLRAVFEHVPMGMAVDDAATGRVTNANAALCRMLGYSADELARMHFRDFTHPDDVAEDERLLGEVKAGARDAYTLEKRMVRRDGTLLWAHLTVAAVRDAEGRPRYTVGMTKDITERRLIEAELRRRERELASLTDNSPDVVTRYGPDLRIRFMSAAFERATGVPADRVIGRRLAEVGFTAELTRLLEGGARRVIDEGVAIEAEFEYAGPDGVVRTWSAHVVPERDERARVESALAVTRDVTERTRARRALRESEERFRALVEHSSDLIAILEPDGRVRYASPAQARLLGHAAADFPALVAYDLVHPEDVALARDRLADAAAPDGGAGADRPLRIRRRDGTYRSFLVRVSDLRADAAVCGIVVNARDVTDELRLQERLTQAQKMEALGQLAGGVAHDFNNILAAIASYGQLLRDDLPPGSRAAEDAGEIVRAAARGAAVTGQLLAFSRRQALETEVIDLGAIVRDTARMLRPLLPSSIALRLPAADATPAHARATRAQVEQIVLNLAVNARDAMPEGGTIDVRVGTRVRADGAGGADALLVVADTGVGMSPAVRARAFEPFFTTKPAGRGTGLGLATVYGLVRQFGGTVEVESAEGAGTTFTVVLPLAVPPAVAPAAGAERVPATGRGARLLLAEDEEPVRASLARALGRAGHTVVAVADGQAALDVLRAGTPVDLVLSDVAMPRLGGHELAAAVARERPSVRVVLMSGYAELDGAVRPPPAVAGFVAKPFEIGRLLQLVDDLLRGAAA